MIVECVLLVTIIWQIGFDYISHDGLEDSWFLQLYIYIYIYKHQLQCTQTH
jgi:hypothetical protein